jgi:hypothetical protein
VAAVGIKVFRLCQLRDIDLACEELFNVYFNQLKDNGLAGFGYSA